MIRFPTAQPLLIVYRSFISEFITAIEYLDLTKDRMALTPASRQI